MSLDKIDLILEKLERIEKKVDSIINNSPEERVGIEEESLEDISQPNNQKELEKVREELKTEVEKERAELEAKEVKEFLENKEQSPLISSDELPEIWANLLKEIKEQVSYKDFDWFLKLKPITFIGDILVIEAGALVQTSIETELLEKVIYELTGKEIKVKFDTLDSKLIKALT
ncbi:MAG: hypothetical protein ACQERJ_04505 [Bacillota bacterium]